MWITSCVWQGVLMVLVAGVVAYSSPTLTQGNFYPGEEWVDTEGQPIQAHGGAVLYVPERNRFYWYGENKDGPTHQPDPRYPARVDLVGVACYSSADLLMWSPEGVVLPPDASSLHADLHPSRVMERPTVLYNHNTSQYVMWMHIDSRDYQAARAGVAVSLSPTGPFVYRGSVRPHGQESRDLTVFEDPQHAGVAWLVYSSENNMVTHIGALNADYTQVNGTFVRALVNRQREAPAVFYHAGQYFLLTSGCTGWAPNQAEIFVARHMLGPWRSLGDPARGGDRAAREKTFFSQGAFVLPLPNLPGRFVLMGDRWNQSDLRSSRYVWLPLWVQGPPATLSELPAEEAMLWSTAVLAWMDKWSFNDLRDAPVV